MQSALSDYEGLVFTTARMFASIVRMEEDDLRQELRIRVWRAVETYDATKTRIPLKNYVYGCVANKIKDFKRNAARRAKYGVEFEYIEDQLGLSDSPTVDAFVGEHLAVSREEVYGSVDGLLDLPASVTPREARVLVLMMVGMSSPEIRLRLGVSRGELTGCMEGLRAKFSGWVYGDAEQVVDLAALAA